MKVKFERVFKKLKKDFRHKTTILIRQQLQLRKEPREKLLKEKRLQDVQETHKKEPQEVLGRQKRQCKRSDCSYKRHNRELMIQARPRRLGCKFK